MTTRQNFVGGAWISGGAPVPNVNPSNIHDVVGEYEHATASDVHAAVAAARSAFRRWSVSSIEDRAEALDRIGSEILARRDELGTLLAREEGKTRAEAVAEAVRAGKIFKFFAGEALRPGGECVPSVRESVTVEVTREPLGVIGIITPWNFPLAIPAWKIAPALAYGNCVVFKPAELVPASAWALADIIARSGVPAGVFNLVMGAGRSVGQAVCESPGIDAVTFTGSQAVGEQVAMRCAQRLARVQLEMGGKNPLVILDDAHLDTAVDCAVQSAFYSTGQRCTAASRLVVTAGIHDEFILAMISRMRALQVDDALKVGTDIGPAVDMRQLAQDLDYIEWGKRDGATLVTGGTRLERSTEGYFIAPALFSETSPAMRINRDEIFGPVAGIIRVKDYDEALSVANDTPYGLSAGIVTTSLKHAAHFRRHSQAGMVMVNLPTAGVDYHVPFGGRKKSSYGPREQGCYAREFYTQVKTAYMKAA